MDRVPKRSITGHQTAVLQIAVELMELYRAAVLCKGQLSHYHSALMHARAHTHTHAHTHIRNACLPEG